MAVNDVPEAPPLPLEHEGDENINAKNASYYGAKQFRKEMQFRLVGALEVGDDVMLKQLIVMGVNLNAMIVYSKTPLIHAIELDRPYMALTILESGALPDQAEFARRRCKPIHFASIKNMTPFVQWLLHAGVSVNSPDAGDATPLHYAAFHGSLDTVRLLLANGADVNARNNINRTAFHLASERRHVTIMDALLEAGADINAQDVNGWTAIFHSIICDHVYITKCLISRGIDPNVYSETRDTALHVACARLRVKYKKIAMSSSADYYKRLKKIPDPEVTDFLTGSSFSSFDVIQSLINAGADVNFKNNQLESPLFLVMANSQIVNEMLVHFLVAVGANLNNESWVIDDYTLNKDAPDLVIWCRLQLSCPVTLKLLCRGVIRKCLSNSITSRIGLLPLPSQLKEFLNLRDFYEARFL